MHAQSPDFCVFVREAINHSASNSFINWDAFMVTFRGQMISKLKKGALCQA